MLPRAAIVGALIVSASCNKSGGGDAIGAAPSAAAGSAARPGSGGSFSSDLARELGAGGGGSGASAPGASPSSRGEVSRGEVPRGEVPRGEVPRGEARAMAAGAVPPSDLTAKAGDVAGKAGSGVATAAAGAARSEPSPVSGSGPAAGAGSAATPESPAKTAPTSAGTAPDPHGPVKVPADLAAIKLSLLPNWDRDIDEAGTFQYVVRIKGTQNTKTFTFHYGYDDPKAPRDHEQYKKYLQDAKLLVGELKDRQRGAAWYLEGTDAAGLPAFRYQVVYGGKHLICYGSQYKDADSSRLGDDRDQTLIQAKQICETLAL